VDAEVIDLVTKFGALGVLIYLTPMLRRIDVNMARLAALVPAVFDGLRDAGVQLPEPATVRSATGSLVRRLLAVALVAFALTFMLSGCSATADVREGLADLQRDLTTYRNASEPRTGAHAPPRCADPKACPAAEGYRCVSRARHEALGAALESHAAEMVRRTR
jgi:hypothetical protein